MATQKAKRASKFRGWPGLYQRYPHQALCDCGARILAGFYEGWPIHFDPPMLSQFGECEALLNGCRTFQLCDPNIYRRTVSSITRHPVPLGGGIHREHKCGIPAVSAKGHRPIEFELFEDTGPGF